MSTLNSDRNHMFGGRAGAVSLTFDDGTANQLEKAVPHLEDRGLRGTFYLNPRDRLIEGFADEWSRVALAGHEIGNHTLTHPCPAAITGGRGLEDLTLDDIDRDIDQAAARLQPIAPHQTEWSFAYPCYSTYVGRGSSRQSYVPIIAQRFLAGRAGGEIGFANDPSLLDLSTLHGTPVERMGTHEITSMIDRLAAIGQWVVLVFHDIDGDVLSVDTDRYLRVLDHLVRSKDHVLTGTVVEIAKMIEASTRQSQSTVEL